MALSTPFLGKPPQGAAITLISHKDVRHDDKSPSVCVLLSPRYTWLLAVALLLVTACRQYQHAQPPNANQGSVFGKLSRN